MPDPITIALLAASGAASAGSKLVDGMQAAKTGKLNAAQLRKQGLLDAGTINLDGNRFASRQLASASASGLRPGGSTIDAIINDLSFNEFEKQNTLITAENEARKSVAQGTTAKRKSRVNAVRSILDTAVKIAGA